MAQGGERRSTAPEARNSAGVRKVPSLLFNLEVIIMKGILFIVPLQCQHAEISSIAQNFGTNILEFLP